VSGYLNRLAERATGTVPRIVTATPRRDALPAIDEFEAVTSLEVQPPPAPAIPARQLGRDLMAKPASGIRPAIPDITPPVPVSPAAPTAREEPSPRSRRRAAAEASPPRPEVVERIQATQPGVEEAVPGRRASEERQMRALRMLEPPTSREPERAPRAEDPRPPAAVPPERKQTTARMLESRVERIEPARVAPAPIVVEPAAGRPEEPRLVIGRLDVEVIPHIPAASPLREVVRVVEHHVPRRQTGSTLGSSRLGYGLEQI
jgi:hypothetical protein